MQDQINDIIERHERLHDPKAEITVWGEKITRKRACEIIVTDHINVICGAGMEDMLVNILMLGWKGLEEWTNQELETYINEELDKENQ